MINNEPLHIAVLLDASVSALITDPEGVYVDGTFGRGGHSREILKRLGAKGRLLAFDKDPEAIAVGQALEKEDARFTIYHGSFTELAEGLASSSISEPLTGILFDLGVSSPQLDDADRGFSFMRDGPLDMRMNTKSGQTAAAWVNNADHGDIVHVLRTYGEEKFAKRIATAIVDRRETKLFTRTLDLAEVIKKAHPRWEKNKHPATRAFQAIRIFINEELEHLDIALQQSVEHLKSEGRLVAISFHSLEDRIVKRFFRAESKGKAFPRGMPVTENMLNKRLQLMSKATKATDNEVDENVRSRSAVMRVAAKI